jgi:hypothetical protein
VTIKSKIIVGSAATIVLAFLIWTINMYREIRDPLCAKTTEARMQALMGVLEAEQPRTFDEKSLRSLLAKYNRFTCRVLKAALGSRVQVPSR